MANGVQLFQTEVSLDDLLGAEEVDHLICSCRVTLTLCGRYDPTNDTVLYLDETPRDCKDCLKVWKSTGCGVCACNAYASCVPCLQRYHAHVASTHRC